jgi:iron complex outermembrane receptor protein
MTAKPWLLASTTMLLMTGGALPALAQQTDVDTLVITAAKRQTRLIDTPMSLTLIDGETLTSANAIDFAGFAKLVPGLSFTDAGPGNKRYALRGLQSAGEPEVALYYDEIPIAGVPGGSLDTGDSQPDLSLVDVERIEVLRGPQGTLYGNGAMGGAIRILSRRPDLKRFAGEVQAQGSATSGGGASARASGVLNIPLVRDRLALRLVGYSQYDDGWINSTPTPNIALRQINAANINWRRGQGGRILATLRPSSRWSLTAIGYYQAMKVGDAFETYPTFAASDPYVAKAFVRKPWRDTSRMANLISDYDLGPAALTVTAGYQERSLVRVIDTTRFVLSQFGCTAVTWGHGCTTPPLVPAASYGDEFVRSWSGEVRLASQASGPLTWTVGVFTQSTRTRRKVQVATTDAAGYVQLGPYDQLKGRLFARTNDDAFDQYAVFGEAAYALAPGLTATLGGRWFHSDRSDQQVILQQFFPGAPTGAQPYQSFGQGRLFKKIELSYQSRDSGLVFVQAAQGFRAGGPNYPGGFALSAPPYSADSVWDYEVGWKGHLADQRVFVTAAAFDIEWKDLQRLLPQALFSYIVNGGRARSQGAELEARVAASRTLNLTVGATYNHARLVGNQPVSIDPLSQTFSGDRLANVPDWTLNASADHVAQLGRGYRLSTRIDGAYQSARGSLVARANPAYLRIKSYALFSAHLALDDEGPWQVRLDIENLLDRFAQLSGRAEDSNLVPTVTPARPRTVSLGLRATF